MVKTIRQLLDEKGSQVWVVQPDQTAEEAVQIMVERNVGALLVRDVSGVAGIISERDLIRSVAARGLPFADTSVGDFMTKDVLYLKPDQSVNEALRLMATKEVRHLPVLERGSLVGMVSVRDLIRELMQDMGGSTDEGDEGHSRH